MVAVYHITITNAAADTNYATCRIAAAASCLSQSTYSVQVDIIYVKYCT